tara:strand:- start:246 stop:953 length:708 start_codon:yes stop_codon:yes gene_type:complete
MANGIIGNHPSHCFQQVESIDTTGKQLTHADSGKIFMCDQNASGIVEVFLPKISTNIAGWYSKFILRTPSSNTFKLIPHGAVTGGGTTTDDDKMYFQRPAGPLRGSATVNVSSLGDGAGESFDITVTGATTGDACLAAPVVDTQELTITAHVRATNTVEVRVQNESGGTVDLASTTWYAYVWDKFSGNVDGDPVDNVLFETTAKVGSELDMFCDGTNWYAIARGRDSLSFASTDS